MAFYSRIDGNMPLGQRSKARLGGSGVTPPCRAATFELFRTGEYNMATVSNSLARSIRMALLIGAASLAPAVSAQTQATPQTQGDGQTGTPADQSSSTSKARLLQTVTVTGSRIPSVDVETQQPVFTLTQADIKKTGLTNVGDIVNQLTVMSTPGFNKSSVLSGAGGDYVNMRNLGSQRVLILVNGKRWATGIGGNSDISDIPASLIERVEVLKDGASAIYGSDAISGVVNFILKDRFSGAQVSTYYGQNQEGDGTSKQASFTTGLHTDRGSIIFSVNHNERDTVWTKKRALTTYAYSPNHPNGTLEAGPWGLIYNSPANPGQTIVVNHSSVIDAGLSDHTGAHTADPRNPANYHVYTGDPADEFNYTAQKMYQMPTQLNSIFTHGAYSLTDTISATLTAMYSDRKSKNQISGNPNSWTAQQNFPVLISGQSYYNPFPGTDLQWNRMMTEVPPSSTEDFKTLHLDGGVQGYFDFGAHELNWDVGFNYNRTEGVTRGTGEFNLVAERNALGPSFLNSDGVVQCGTPAAPVVLGTNLALGQCTPVAILGGIDAMTPQALAYLLAPSTSTFGATDRSYNADISGSLLTLPAGDLGFAAGVESRNLSGYSHPDTFAQTGLTTTNAANSTDGSYRVNAVYVEFNVPLLRDLPAVQSLSADVASRYSHYSNFGSTTDNKYSLLWKPIEDLLVRANYAEGFRAPTLSDLFGGGGQGFDHYLDPCDSVYGAAASNSTVAAKCAAQGVLAGYRQRDRQGLPITSVGATQSSTPSFVGVGNAVLQPETAITRTLGLVFSPHYVPGLDLTLDWYGIRINNEVQSISAQYVLNQCYLANSNQYCSQFTRFASALPIQRASQIETLSRGNANLGHIVTKGYDFSANYRFPTTPYGNFRARLDSNYVAKYESQSGPGAVIQQAIGIIPLYRVRANLSLTWGLKQFGASWRLRYFSSLRDECYSKNECNEPGYTSPSWPFGTGANRKGALAYNDLNAHWDAPWNGTLTAGVNNIFDKKPAPLYSAKDLGVNGAVGLDPGLDIDRFWYVSYTQKF